MKDDDGRNYNYGGGCGGDDCNSGVGDVANGRPAVVRPQVVFVLVA